MNVRLFATLLILCVSAGAFFAQDPTLDSGGALRPDQACFDVQSYRLALTVDPAPEKRRIDGSLTMTALMTADSPRIALQLDSVFDVRGVSLRQGSATWKHENGVISIHAPKDSIFRSGETREIQVHYGGRPRVAKNPPWKGGFSWKKTRSGAPWIATSCQGQGADLWWPCKDHPSDKPERMELDIRVPEGLVCATNGVLIETSTDKGWTRTRWDVRNPINNYCVALNIAPYVKIEDELKSIDGKTTIPIHFYALPEDEKRARRILPQFIEHLKWFEKTLGPYPFRNEKYGIAQTPHLGMEHQTIIAYGNRFGGLRGGYDWLHHHELAHEWWGNLVTCRDWKDMWIHEGFGTYMQALYLEESRGRAAYDRAMAQSRMTMRNRKAVAPKKSMSSDEIYFASSSDSDIYYKGAWVLHALRWLVGDTPLRKLLREFCYPTPEAAASTGGAQVRFVSTDDFQTMASRYAPQKQDLAWFFDLYLRQARLPELQHERLEDGSLVLRWRTPKDLPFPMPVPVHVDGKPTRIEVPKGGIKVLIDPKSKVEIDPESRLFRKTWDRKRLRRGKRRER